MSRMSYSKKKIFYYELYNAVLLMLVLLFGVVIGRYFFYENSLNILSGIVLGIVGGGLFMLIDRNIRKTLSYEKGDELERKIAEKLTQLGYSCTLNIRTGYGDLDILAEKEGTCYGIEVKNWSGKVSFVDGILKYKGYFNKSNELDRLLSNCKYVRDTHFGKNSYMFVKPLVIFGYNAYVDIPDNKIIYRGSTVLFLSVQELANL